MNANKWYQLSGTDADVVISTRIRLARNLSRSPFPVRMNGEDRTKVNKLIKDAVLEGGSALSGRFKYIEMDKLSQRELVSLVERHLISPEFARDPKGRALLLLDDESVSIMLCEEDHIRLQVLGQGMEPAAAYEMADRLDTLLSERLDYAYNGKLGYLTACPTNLGTAMRASVMVHLPGIVKTGSLRSLCESVAKLGLVIRGMYGEGSDSRGAIFQISNQETLGISEKDTIDKLTRVIGHITRLEREARKLIEKDPSSVDGIWRAYGVLKTARMLSGEEFVGLFSPVRMGAALGILDGVSLDKLNALFIAVQPATMMCAEDKDLSPTERDRKRADMVRAALS